ncbi:DedA family protein [Achromobacter spanius]|uniref:DedA family protein n=1 Tax=Achromobacter spanius TaxID=217203 RepID=UPI000F8F9DB5|nr:DedA family protein [Achromobacter spanius]AZS77754.1 DedA family protein [Achromobacter spanius]
MDIASWVQSWGLPAVGVGSFLEGESVLLIAGAAAARGHLSIQAVMAVAAVASFIGDQLFFLIGRYYGSTLLARFPALQPRALRVALLLERHHLPLILSIRFLYGLRVAGPIVIGMSRVPWSRFLVLNFVGAVCWAMLIGGIGYGTGHALAYALQSVDADELWGLALLAVSVSLTWLIARHSPRGTSGREGAHPDLTQAAKNHIWRRK